MRRERNDEMRHRHSLLECLQDRRDSGWPVSWGVVLTARTDTRELQATTTGGTTVVLTRRLLQVLTEVDSYLAGRQPVQLRDPGAREEDWPCSVWTEDRPALVLELAVYVATGWQTVGGVLEMTTTLGAEEI